MIKRVGQSKLTLKPTKPVEPKKLINKTFAFLLTPGKTLEEMLTFAKGKDYSNVRIKTEGYDYGIHREPDSYYLCYDEQIENPNYKKEYEKYLKDLNQYEKDVKRYLDFKKRELEAIENEFK